MVGKVSGTASALSGATFGDESEEDYDDESEVDEGEGVSIGDVLEGKKVR